MPDRFLRWLGLAAGFCLTGCATLTHGFRQTVTVVSDPPGATVTATAEFAQPLTGFTPVHLDLRRGRTYTIVIEKRGFQGRTVTVESGFSHWFLATAGNWWNYVIPGLIVDTALGGVYGFDQRLVDVALTPGEAGAGRETEGVEHEAPGEAFPPERPVSIRAEAPHPITRRWGVGLRVGASSLTKDIAELSGGQTEQGATGPMVGGQIVYGLRPSDVLGLNVERLLGFTLEWEAHAIGMAGLDVGKAVTLSLIPVIELRPVGWGAMLGSEALAPYLSLGAGVNLNAIRESSSFRSACCRLEPDNTLALKIGIGADYFLKPDRALNLEMAWKRNAGEKDVRVGDRTVNTVDHETSVFSVLVGLRAYFGRTAGGGAE